MKLAEVLQDLDSSDITAILYSLKGNDSKRDSRLRDILKIIQSASFEITNEELTELLINKAYYIKPSLLRKDLHDLLEIVIHFIGIKHIENHPLSILRYKRKGIELLIRNEIGKKLSNHLGKEKGEFKSSSIDLIDEYILTRNEVDLANSTISLSIKSREDHIESLKYAYRSLKVVFHIEAFRLAIGELGRIFERSQPASLASIIPSIPSNDLLNTSNLLKFYNDLYKTLKVEKPLLKDISRLLDSFDKLMIKLPHDEFRTIYEGLMNYFIFQFNRGNDTFNFENFRIRKIAVEKGIYRDSIDTPVYRNICFMACRVQEYDWALQFANDYKHKLPLSEQTSAYSFNIARIYYYDKKYEEVIMTLRDVEYKDMTYNLNSKLILMMAYYELEEYDPLIAAIRAFKVFLRRRRNISQARKENFNGYCDVLFNIVRAEENRDKKRLQKASEILDSIPSIPSKDLLKRMIVEVGNKLI